MLSAGFASPLAASKVLDSTRRRGEDAQLSRQREMLNESRHGGNNDAFREIQSDRHHWQVRLAVGGIDPEFGRWPEVADIRAAQWFRPVVVWSAREASRNAWLSEALEELADCPAAAVEEGLDEPSELGLIKAEAVLRGISGFVEEQPDIYPMDRGSIAVDLRRPEIGSSVVMVVEQDGSGALFYRTSGKKGRVRVENAVDLLKERELLDIGIAGSR